MVPDDGWYATVGLEQLYRDEMMGRHTSSKGGGDFQQCPPGSHLAICVELIDLGTQHGEYKGKPTALEKVVIRWETPNETMEDGQPFLVSSFYTNSIGEKANLRADLQAWRGREFTNEELDSFDLNAILGKPCMLSVIHNESGKAKVTGVMAVPKGMTVPKPKNTPKAFWIEEWDTEAFNALPEFFQQKIKESDEYLARSMPAKAESFADMTDDIPF